MYNHNAYANSLDDEILAADPVKLVRLLYEGALESVEAARKCVFAGDIAGRSRNISKAVAILNELALNLDHNQGGEISRSLAELYEYMIRQLNEANFQQAEAPIAEVAGLLRTLEEAWRQCEVSRPNTVPAVYAASPEEYTPLSLTA